MQSDWRPPRLLLAIPTKLEYTGGMELKTTVAVIDALGGLRPVARITGSTPKAVWNWKSSGKFPAKTYMVIKSVLTDQGFEAPASLWGMSESDA